MKISLVAALALASLASFAVLGTGCAAPTSDAESEDTTDDALTGRSLPGVAAVTVAEVRAQTTVLASTTLGAPKKVKGILAAVKRLKSTDPQPRCLERDTTRLTFLDAAGQKLATVDTHCAGYGSISFESGKAGYAVRFDTQVVADAKAAPFAVGDALWGITKIQLSRPGRNDKRTLTGDDMKPILGGFDLDAIPDPYALMPRCMPSHAVTFERGDASVAHTSFLCGTGSPAPASIKAHFSAPNPANPDGDDLASGGITMDPRAIVAAFGN